MQVSRPTEIIRSPHDRENPYTMIRTKTLQDVNLSFEARGLLAYLLSKPREWVIQVAELAKAGGCGRDRVYRIISELESAGYITRERYNSAENGTFTWRYQFYEEPQQIAAETQPRTATAKPADTTPAPAPALKAPRATPAQRDPNLDNPAVKLYRETCKITPNDVQRAEIVAKIRNIEAWGKILRVWMGKGYNPRNVAGAIDMYATEMKSKPRYEITEPTPPPPVAPKEEPRYMTGPERAAAMQEFMATFNQIGIGA